MRTIILLLILVSSSNLGATEQIRDRLILKGDTFYISNSPIEDYLYEMNIKADSIFNCQTTACWRGVIGYWSIRNDSLILLELTDCCSRDRSRQIPLDVLFNDIDTNNQIVWADWFTGEFIFDFGAILIEQDALIPRSISEFGKKIIFKNGVVIDSIVYDNRSSRKSQYYTDPHELLEIVYSNIQWQNLNNIEKEAFIMLWMGGDGTYKVNYRNHVNKKIRREIEKAFKLFPGWHYLLKNGEYLSYSYPFLIIINKENRMKYVR